MEERTILYSLVDLLKLDFCIQRTPKNNLFSRESQIIKNVIFRCQFIILLIDENVYKCEMFF